MILESDINGRESIEKYLSLLILGALKSLENRKISTEELLWNVFPPDFVYGDLKEQMDLSKLHFVMDLGTELDALNTLVPEKMPQSISELKCLLNEILLEYKNTETENNILFKLIME